MPSNSKMLEAENAAQIKEVSTKVPPTPKDGIRISSGDAPKPIELGGFDDMRTDIGRSPPDILQSVGGKDKYWRLVHAFLEIGAEFLQRRIRKSLCLNP